MNGVSNSLTTDDGQSMQSLISAGENSGHFIRAVLEQPSAEVHECFLAGAVLNTL